jgi:endonuclease-3 related protein
MHDKLLDIHRVLLHHYGPRHWWPAETPFEVVVGAILTQNTAWRNVEKAIANLKGLGAFTPEALFNELHALLVNAGKDFCRPRPRCEGCPLEGF